MLRNILNYWRVMNNVLFFVYSCILRNTGLHLIFFKSNIILINAPITCEKFVKTDVVSSVTQSGGTQTGNSREAAYDWMSSWVFWTSFYLHVRQPGSFSSGRGSVHEPSFGLGLASYGVARWTTIKEATAKLVDCVCVRIEPISVKRRVKNFVLAMLPYIPKVGCMTG